MKTATVCLAPLRSRSKVVDTTTAAANKAYVNRSRRSGEVYRPAIEIDDLDWSTKTFLDRLERELR